MAVQSCHKMRQICHKVSAQFFVGPLPASCVIGAGNGIILAKARFTALIAFGDRDTSVSLSLVVGPLLRGSSSLLLAFKTKKTSLSGGHFVLIGAGNGIRTHDINLGKVALYP